MTQKTLALKIGAAALLASALALTTSAQAANNNIGGPLILKDQGSFFVGGDTEFSDAISGQTSGPGGFGYSNSDYIKVNQMYVQFQVPMKSARNIPIVLLHGCCLTAKTWEDTPDGRMGWAEYFLRNNHAVYLPDQSSRARSGFDATTINEVKLGQKPATALPNVFLFGRVSAWDLFRFGPAYPTPFADEQFPVESLSDFGNQVIPDLNATLPTPNPTYQNMANLAILAGGAVLVGHSESGFFPEQAALVNSSAVKGVISIEGVCSPLNGAQIKTLAKIPTLIMFGDHLTGSPISASLWSSALQGCQTFVQQLKAAGGKATLVQLPQIGLHGNSHMLMQDRNNLEIADYVLDWIDKNVKQNHGRALVGKNRNASDN
ncbi:conserved hypothetical protein [Methylocella silvestris BL2]|uniref:Esterase n=1 Tax=Methylocella silvestris (strain DSM 15510 / CIP 108128 / LMG 27833 / NCIMB 13906 / BL2) TaxID=395965 RepID=B8EI83_METSB|nr:hypothetical protein [Methylocella silvestris]ACK50565.1 conserved hypothetical protein [Methylocella silvestris BL2]